MLEPFALKVDVQSPFQCGGACFCIDLVLNYLWVNSRVLLLLLEYSSCLAVLGCSPQRRHPCQLITVVVNPTCDDFHMLMSWTNEWDGMEILSNTKEMREDGGR
jgi:hypothetical protein